MALRYRDNRNYTATNYGEDVAEATPRESLVARRCPMLSEKARGRLDTAASGSPERPHPAPWRLARELNATG